MRGFAIILYLLVVVFLIIIPTWKIFVKAGKPGWAAIIPIYSTLVLLQVIGRPWWWILMLIIPIVNIVFAIMIYDGLSHAFGKGIGTTIGLIFLSFIFLPILGYGPAKYEA